MWKILQSKEIFTHPRLSLIEDDVELPNGSQTKYLKFKDEGNSVTIICIRKDNKILLQKEYSHPPQRKIFQFPGGFVPKEEDIKVGANRELMEEAGYRANELVLLGTYLLNNRRSSASMYVYLATNIIEEKIEGDIEEELENYWFNEQEIDNLIKNDKIENPNILASWSIYKSKK